MDALARARGGQVDSSIGTIERPPTAVRGPDGVIFNLPRASAAVPIYRKINSRLADPATGRRARGRAGRGGRAGPVDRVSFGMFVIAAVVGWKAFQLLSRSVWGRKREHQQQQQDGQLVEWASDEEEEQPLPPVRTIPAMLRRALPRLGPPSRAKQLSQQRRDRPRRAAPSARQKMQPHGVAQRRTTMLERMDAAARQQARELGLDGRPALPAGLPAPGPGPVAALPAPAAVGHTQMQRPQRQQRRAQVQQQGEQQ